jgi:hypothetical protein
MTSFTRTDVTFESGKGSCAAWYYKQVDAGTDAPIIVMAHGFAGVRRLRLDSYAEKFADAGYRVLLFDYRHFGDSPGEPRQLLDIDQQLADWRSAVAYANSLSAPPARMVLWGTSLGGGHVLTTAASDEGPTAVIAQVPHVSGIAASRSAGPLMSVRLAALGLVDVCRAALGRSPYYIPAAGPPGKVAAMTTPDAVPGRNQLISQSNIGREIDALDLMVSARVILRIVRYAPGRRAALIECPVLVQIANQDAITPTRVADRVARRIPHATIKHYDLRHFDAYVEPHFTGVVADQLAFLQDAVPL